MSFQHNHFSPHGDLMSQPPLGTSTHWGNSQMMHHHGARNASSWGDGIVMSLPFMKPPASTPDRFVFGAEVPAHMPGLKMFPESITANLPEELAGKIKETEWSEWMGLLDQDRKSHECGDSLGCYLAAFMSMVFAPYVCIRPYSRSKTMKKFIEKINQELFVPKGMFLKQQEGFWAGAPMMQGTAACSWFSIALSQTESAKLKREPKRIAIN